MVWGYDKLALEAWGLDLLDLLQQDWGYDKRAQEAWDFGPAGPPLAGLEGCGLGLRQARPGGLGFGPAGPTLGGLEGCGLGL